MELAIAQLVHVQVHAQDPCGTGWVTNALRSPYFRAAGRLALEFTSGTQWKPLPYNQVIPHANKRWIINSWYQLNSLLHLKWWTNSCTVVAEEEERTDNRPWMVTVKGAMEQGAGHTLVQTEDSPSRRGTKTKPQWFFINHRKKGYINKINDSTTSFMQTSNWIMWNVYIWDSR